MMPAGVHEFASDLPEQISIWTTNVYVLGGIAFQYTMRFIDGENDRGIYVCPTTTETGRDGEQMFILFSEGYWYVCEGKFACAKKPCEIRQACFRTRADFWKSEWHSWEINVRRDNTPGRKYTDGQWSAGKWSGALWCETTQTAQFTRAAD